MAIFNSYVSLPEGNSILALYLVYVIGDSPEYGLVVDRLIFLTIWVWLKTRANRWASRKL